MQTLHRCASEIKLITCNSIVLVMVTIETSYMPSSPIHAPLLSLTLTETSQLEVAVMDCFFSSIRRGSEVWSAQLDLFPVEF